jgi:hypothetical protein
MNIADSCCERKNEMLTEQWPSPYWKPDGH